jgi:hypothetical protein
MKLSQAQENDWADRDGFASSSCRYFLNLSGILAAWRQAHWLDWQHLGSGHLANEQTGSECPQDVRKKHYFEEIPFASVG